MKRFSFFQLFVVVLICAATFFVVFAWINTQTSRLDLLKMQIKGRNIYRSLAILAQDNYVNGENRWRYWPNDIGQNFSNSTEYFSYLMDVKNYGKTDWKPLLCEASLEDVYSGRSSSSPTVCTLWSVAKNVTSNTSDSIPVLISKNVDVKILLGKRSPDSSLYKLSSFGGSVFYRKDGSACIATKRKYFDSHLYRTAFFDYTTNALPVNRALKYLTPTGEVFPKQ